MYTFQSTHPRRVWRSFGLCSCGYPWVSIHTPTKGVTDFLCIVIYESLFQSTHPRRVWPPISSPFRTFASVSIHTPTKGVTLTTPHKCYRDMFQSTHPRRVWHLRPLWARAKVRFNPHTHEGCDLLFMFYVVSKLCFNPHTHEGCDHPLLLLL